MAAAMSSWIELIRLVIPFIAGSLTTIAGIYVKQRIDDRKHKTREIYRPLYNELVQVANGNYPYNLDKGRFESTWEHFDPYQQSLVGSTLQHKMVKYVENIEQANRLISTIKRELNNRESSRIILRGEVVMQGHEGEGPSSTLPVSEFVNQFGLLLITARSKQDLEDRFISYAKERVPHHYESVDNWGEEYYSFFFDVIRDAEEEWKQTEEVSSRIDLLRYIEQHADQVAQTIAEKMSTVFS